MDLSPCTTLEETPTLETDVTCLVIPVMQMSVFTCFWPSLTTQCAHIPVAMWSKAETDFGGVNPIRRKYCWTRFCGVARQIQQLLQEREAFQRTLDSGPWTLGNLLGQALRGCWARRILPHNSLPETLPDRGTAMSLNLQLRRGL
jgi:hypothetical protein